jgi:biotin carboxylase
MPSTPPALVLLGGFAVAWNQRFLHAAHARGLAVLLVDAPGPHVDRLLANWRNSEQPLPAGFGLAGAAELATIVDLVAGWSDRYDLRGVCCLREEYVEPAAVVADLLGLPSPGQRAARVCRNKYLQRQYLAAFGPASTPVPPAGRDAAVAAASHFPLVVKPVGRLASSGVRLVTDRTALRDCLGDYAADETLLFEERVPGPEFSVESLSCQGEVRYLGITQKRTTEEDSEFFVELGHTSPPSQLPPADRASLARVHAAVLQRLGFHTGMAHAEYRITPAGRPVLIEIAARPPGDSILALHWLATGAPLEDAIVGLCVGERVSHPAPRRFARQAYLPHRPGTFAGLRLDRRLGLTPIWFDPGQLQAMVVEAAAADDPPAVRCVVALKDRGTPLGPLRESGDRVATIVLDAASPAELDDLEACCRTQIAVQVDAGRDRGDHA